MRADRVRKSLGAENTFSMDMFTFEAACDALQPIIEKVWRTAKAPAFMCGTVTLKVKYADFKLITRSLEPLFPVTKGIRLLGITLKALSEKQLEREPQLRLSL